MHTNGAEGFFPEREVLRARRLRAVGDRPADPYVGRTRAAGAWVLWWVGVFWPLLVFAIAFRWNGHFTAQNAKVFIVGLCIVFVFAACGPLIAVGLCKSLRRTNTPISRESSGSFARD